MAKKVTITLEQHMALVRMLRDHPCRNFLDKGDGHEATHSVTNHITNGMAHVTLYADDTIGVHYNDHSIEQKRCGIVDQVVRGHTKAIAYVMELADSILNGEVA